MGKLPIYKWSFSIAMLVYQRVWIKIYVSYHLWKDERPMNIYKNHLWILVNVNRRLQMCDPEPYELCFNLFLNQIGSWIPLLLVNFPWFMVHQFSKMFHLWFNPIFWFPGWWFSNIFYFPFHIWDVIPTPLTKSIIFQDGEIAPPTRFPLFIRSGINH